MSLTYIAPTSTTLDAEAAAVLGPTFAHRVAAGAVAIAHAVLDDSSPPTNQAERAAYARALLRNPLGTAQQGLAWAVVSSASDGLLDSASDIDIMNRIAAVWDHVSAGF